MYVTCVFIYVVYRLLDVGQWQLEKKQNCFRSHVKGVESLDVKPPTTLQ